MADNTCTCGHVIDEHVYRNGHYAECDVDGCDCAHYEADEPEED